MSAKLTTFAVIVAGVVNWFDAACSHPEEFTNSAKPIWEPSLAAKLIV